MSSEVIEENKDEDNHEETKGGNSTSSVRLCRLPMARIKSIMKMDPEVQLASGEAVFLITRLTVRLIYICAYVQSSIKKYF